MPKSSGSMYSSILMLENIWCHYFTWSGSNSQEIVNLFQFSSGPQWLTIGRKFTLSYEFGPLHVKCWCHMFANMKIEEYMESEPSSIFRVNVVAKNILLGFLGTQRKAAFVMWCIFLRKLFKKTFLNQTIILKCFLY